jgi:hypothetical protein
MTVMVKVMKVSRWRWGDGDDDDDVDGEDDVEEDDWRIW